MTPDPTPPAPAASDAAAVLKALAHPARLRLLATVAERGAAGADCSLAAVAAALGVPVRSLLKDVTRLRECGALALRDGRVLAADLDRLTRTADALVDQLPITGLLAGAPELRRYFANGRLTALPADRTVQLTLAPLLARLLPDDRPLTEAEVNAVLRQVHPDHAALRRLLVDFGQLTRDGAADYRRSG